jgi:hypothetical protein
MYDILIILLFWAMVLSPCMVALNVGIESYTLDETEEFTGHETEFELSSRRPAPRKAPDA